jgi:DNA-binding SARP family transcriptional activator/tetratricopeptide (TPR) repeat protein
MARNKPLTLRFLGDMELLRGGERIDLPPSKKTRALLAYLVVSARSHRRERLCSLLWDITDDPKGALRWSLSKLRPLVDESGIKRIVSNRETVRFVPEGAGVDVLQIRASLAVGLETLSTGQLKELVPAFRGEFLEGMELPDFNEFHGWCIAEREELRRLHVSLLDVLVKRLSPIPEEALPFARALALANPLDELGRAALLKLLILTGRRREAEQQYEAACRLMQELGADSSAELRRRWKELSQLTPTPTPAANRPEEPRTAWPFTGPQKTAGAPGARTGLASARAVAARLKPSEEVSTVERSFEAAGAGESVPLVGRMAEKERIGAILEEARTRHLEQVVMVKGEPGVGKTRLLREFSAAVREAGGTVLGGCSYEAECSRPYGPWIDALRCLPATAVGTTLGNDLSLLLPELPREVNSEPSRDRLFGAVVELIAARSYSAAPVLLAFDDVQWYDAASAELLHYVARMCRHRPLMIMLATRAGELPDNEPMLRLLRGLRRDHSLLELNLRPLSREETGDLVHSVAQDADPELIFTESSGNPLYALELARAHPNRREGLPQSLAEIISDRIDSLPVAAADVLRWAAVLGCTFSTRRLKELAFVNLDTLISVLETLERQALLHAVPDRRCSGEYYVFSHEIVSRAVYAAISAPRRRLMHARVAELLSGYLETDDTLAGDVVHHAALAGDLSVAASACVTAGDRCLRLFANAEADRLVRRGMRYADQLGEPMRVKLTLELLRISFSVRRPEHPEELAATIEKLAEQALDQGCMEHARLGFHLLSYLRWEGGDWSEAQRQTLRAEGISRAADEKERVIGMAETARCLTLLERDLVQAQSLILEARTLSARAGIESYAIPDAMGMLCLHQGKLEEAADNFHRARDLAHRQGDRLAEFHSLEHLVILELQRECYGAAESYSGELIAIAKRFREGSEAPFAHLLGALARYAGGDDTILPSLEQALELLRLADAKHRLAYALTRTAEIDLRRGRASAAHTRADEALRLAQLLQRPSELVLARATLTRAAAAMRDETGFSQCRQALARESLQGVSAHVRRVAHDVLEQDSRVARRDV